MSILRAELSHSGCDESAYHLSLTIVDGIDGVMVATIDPQRQSAIATQW